MEKIYWAIQNLDTLGGSEMVSVNLANLLCDKYDITLIVSTKETGERLYLVSDKVKVFNLGINPKVTRLNNYVKKYKEAHRYLSLLFLVIKSTVVMFFGRWHYRKKIASLINKEPGLLICSSGESYLFAPKKVKKIYHYHFNSRLFFSFGDRFILAHSHKPNMFVFLSKTTKDIILTKRNDLKDKAVFINNPVRFESTLDLSFHDNTIIVIGRLIKQKNPMLALEVAKELKERKLDFKMKFIGSGALREMMDKYINDNDLSSYIEIKNETPKIKEEILSSDILLITSIYEGYPLCRSEANALSRPAISSNWGDTVYEVVNDGINGFVIDSFDPKPYADKLEEIIKDKNLLKELKKGSYQFSLNSSSDALKKQWCELIESVK